MNRVSKSGLAIFLLVATGPDAPAGRHGLFVAAGAQAVRCLQSLFAAFFSISSLSMMVPARGGVGLGLSL